MLTASSQFDVEIEGNAYVLAVGLELDLPGATGTDVGLAVSRLDVEAQMTSSQPDQSNLTTGYPSAQATFTLAGTITVGGVSYTAADLFGPWNTSSPFYRLLIGGSEVRLSLGMLPAGSRGVPELVRKFTGLVDAYVCNADGTVDFTCIDFRSKLRSVPATPAVVTAPPYNAALTSEFALDALLRAASSGTISSWPARRSNCVLAVGLRTSLWPEVGTLYTSDSQPVPAFASGPWGTGLSAFDTTGTTFTDPIWTLAGTVSADVFCEFLVAGVDIGTTNVTVGTVTAAGGSSIGLAGMLVTVSPTGVELQFGSPSVGPIPVNLSTTPTAGAHIVAVHATYTSGSGTWSGTVYFDGLTQTFSGIAANGCTPSIITHAGIATLSNGAIIAGLQVTTETVPVIDYPFTPAAVLDPSLNPLQAVPAISAGTDPWQTIQSIAEGELGAAGFDEDGAFRFRNRQTLQSASAARDITDAASLVSLSSTTSAATVVNRAQVGYTAWNFGTTANVFTLATNTWHVAAGATKTFIVTLPDPVAAVDTAAAVLADGHDPTDGSTWYRLSRDQAGTVEHTDATVTIEQQSSTKILVTVENAGSYPAWFTSPANYTDITVGSPSLWIGGIPVSPNDEVTADYQYPPASEGGAAGSRWGEVAWQYTGNPWIQDADTADQLCRDVVSALAIPRPVWTGLTIVPDPRLQLADVVHLVDSVATGVDEYGVIEALTISLSVAEDGSIEDYTETLDVRALSAPGGWIAGITGRDEAGINTFAYA